MDTNSPDPTSEAPGRVGAQACLVADIGGTNARFALADAHSGELLGKRSYGTAEFADSAALIRHAQADLGATTGGSIAACAIAIAGPVADGAGRLTNGTLAFSALAVARQLGAPAVLLNDFHAVAAAINDRTEVQAVGPHEELQTGVRAVLGPGTGLGMAYLVPLVGPAETGALMRWQVVASEGGNADFAPTDALELELLAILQRQFATVSIESLVSGRGLVNLYQALCELWGSETQHTSAAAITESALATSDPLSDKCLELFCAMLGSAAGNFALTVGARGGVYLAGGVLPRIREFFLASDFRRRFEERGPLAEYNKQIPTWLVLDPEPGLTGAVFEAQRLLDRANA